MTIKYDIDSLVESFTEHAEFFEKRCIDAEQERIKNGWNDPEAPAAFNLSQALSVICGEIQILKSKL